MRSVLISFCCLWAVAAMAQPDSTVRFQDSLRNKILDRQARQMEQLQALLLADSLRQVDLTKQISSLRATENQKKEELEAELTQLKQSETKRLESQKASVDSLRAFVRGFPVVLGQDTLFQVYSRLGSFSAQDRAQAIGARLEKLADLYFFSPDSLRLFPSANYLDLVYGETVVMSITESDGLWAGMAKEELARQYLQRIEMGISRYREATSWRTLALEAGLAILVLLVLFGLIFLINKLFRWTKLKIYAQRHKRFTGIRLKDYQVMDANRQVDGLVALNTLCKWVATVLAVYLTLPVLFSIFPGTSHFTNTLLDLVLLPIREVFYAVWLYLPHLFTIVVIVAFFHYFLKGLRILKNAVAAGSIAIEGFPPDWANPTFQIIRILVYAFMLVVIFPYLPGSDSPIFKGVSVFLGILFTFSSSGPLSNIIAGLVLTYMRAFKIGDRVKIGDVTGDIIEKTLLVTRLRTPKNEIISLPNSSVMSSHTTNFSSDAPLNGLILHTTVTIGYDVPWRQVHTLLTRAALATNCIEPEPTPFVLQTSLDDFYVSYQVNAYTRHPNRQALIYSQLLQNIQDQFNEAGVEIMSPHYRAERDGTPSTIPPPGPLPDAFAALGEQMGLQKPSGRRKKPVQETG